MLPNIAPGPEIGLPGRILAGPLLGKHRNRPSLLQLEQPFHILDFFGSDHLNRHDTSLVCLRGHFPLHSTPFLEPDPFDRIPGPSLAGNRPNTAKPKTMILIIRFVSAPRKRAWGGLPLGTAGGPVGAAQTPKTDDFRSFKKLVH